MGGEVGELVVGERKKRGQRKEGEDKNKSISFYIFFLILINFIHYIHTVTTLLLSSPPSPRSLPPFIPLLLLVCEAL